MAQELIPEGCKAGEF